MSVPGADNRTRVEGQAKPGQACNDHEGWISLALNSAVAQFWLDLQSQFDIATIEREKGKEIAKRVRPADAA